MLIIECGNIKKYYGDRLILEIDNFKVYSKDRIGVVGLNGMGKTTFLNILCGKVAQDEGWVKRYGSYSYISQLEDSEEKEMNSDMARKFGVNDIWQNYMSGGEKTRFKIAQTLDCESNMIFADEPTCNLDMEGVAILEKNFKEHGGALMVISHDRELLDKLCNKILEVENGKLKLYVGNYSQYRILKQKEKERAQFEYDEYEKEKNRLETAAHNTREKTKAMKNAPSRMGNSEARLHKMGNQKAKANLDRAIKNMEARLENLDKKEKPREIEKIKVDTQGNSRLYSKILISGRNINKTFEKRAIFEQAEFDIYNGGKIALIGPNGCGKSTLLKMIISNDSGLNVARGIKFGYFSQDMDILEEEYSIIDNVMKESIYDETFARILLSRLLFKKEEVYKKVKVLSGGERVKVSFAKILLQDINLLILDEPTNYLDINSLEAVEEALKEYDRTILFVSHDRRFVSSVADNILSIENKKIYAFRGSYEEYIESKNKKIDISKEEVEKRIFILENRLSEIIGKLSTPSKQEVLKELDVEYYKVIQELKTLRTPINVKS